MRAFNLGKLDLTFTFQHEINEANVAMKLSTESGTGLNAICERELGVFGGEAHKQLAKQLSRWMASFQ